MGKNLFNSAGLFASGLCFLVQEAPTPNGQGQPSQSCKLRKLFPSFCCCLPFPTPHPQYTHTLLWPSHILGILLLLGAPVGSIQMVTHISTHTDQQSSTTQISGEYTFNYRRSYGTLPRWRTPDHLGTHLHQDQPSEPTDHRSMTSSASSPLERLVQLDIEEVANLQSKHIGNLTVTTTQSTSVPCSQRPFLLPCPLPPAPSCLQVALSEDVTLWTLEVNEQQPLLHLWSRPEHCQQQPVLSYLRREPCVTLFYCLSPRSERPISSFMCVTQPMDSEASPAVINASRQLCVDSFTYSKSHRPTSTKMSSWKAQTITGVEAKGKFMRSKCFIWHGNSSRLIPEHRINCLKPKLFRLAPSLTKPLATEKIFLTCLIQGPPSWEGRIISMLCGFFGYKFKKIIILQFLFCV